MGYYCTTCGAYLNDTDQVCPSCGQVQNSSAGQAAQSGWGDSSQQNSWGNQSQQTNWSNQSGQNAWNNQSQQTSWDNQTGQNAWNNQSQQATWDNQAGQTAWNNQPQQNNWDNQAGQNAWNNQPQQTSWDNQAGQNAWSNQSQQNAWNGQAQADSQYGQYQQGMQQPQQGMSYGQPQQNAWNGQPQPNAWDQAQQPDTPMKWYKFIIWVQLFLGALSMLASGIMLLTGMHYGANRALVYAYFSSLQIVDVLCGLLYLATAAMAIYVRFQLSSFKKMGPTLYLGYLVVVIVVQIIYIFLTSIIISQLTADVSTISSIIGSIVMIFINKVYFDKRKHLFCN